MARYSVIFEKKHETGPNGSTQQVVVSAPTAGAASTKAKKNMRERGFKVGDGKRSSKNWNAVSVQKMSDAMEDVKSWLRQNPTKIRVKTSKGVFPAVAKRVNGRVKIFVTPDVAKKINPRARCNPLQKVYVERLKLDRGGYTKQGRYSGAGKPVYAYYSEPSGIQGYIRADSMTDAKRKIIKEHHPGIVFGK